MKRSKPLRRVMLRKLLVLSTATLVVLGSILAVFLYGIVYRNSMRSAEKSAENAGSQITLLTNSLNNISSMVAYSSVTQQALSAHNRGSMGQEKTGLSTLFASTAQYIRLIDNFVLLDSSYDYYTSMYVLSDSQRQDISKFVRGIPQQQKNGRVNWYVPAGGLAGRAVLVRSIYSMDSSSIESIGYLAVTLDMGELYSLARQFRYHNDSQLLLADENGRLLYGAQGLCSGELPQSLRRGEACFYAQTENGTVLAAQSTVAGNGWRLVELTPQSAVFSGVWQWAGWSLLVFSLAVLLFGVVIYLVSKSISVPFSKMQQAMRQIERGDFDIPHIQISGISEIDTLLQRFCKMSERLNRTIEEVYRARIRENELTLSAQQSEIEMLQQQINPHFLYNTLDSINWMAAFGATEEVSRMIVALSNFFRFTVSDHSFFTRVADEVAFARNYVYLQQRRFGSALTVTFQVAPEAEDFLTLRLLLQPLIENAIVHGTMRNGKAGLVEIGIAVNGGMLEFTVRDNGVGIEKETVEAILADGGAGRSIGLPNILRRLRLVYKQRHTFEIDSAPMRGTRILIAFPAVHTEEELKKLGAAADSSLESKGEE